MILGKKIKKIVRKRAPRWFRLLGGESSFARLRRRAQSRPCFEHAGALHLLNVIGRGGGRLTSFLRALIENNHEPRPR
jgi:hypothetical protein